MTVPVSHLDLINARILEVSEDRLQGFQQDPIGSIARQTGLTATVVIERIQAMLRAGTIRRVRQTLLATNLAQGALVAWQVPQEKLDAAFEFMFREDPFTGHVVTRSTDPASQGAAYKLWTTLKVPQGYSMTKHGRYLASQAGAQQFRLMPAKKLFVLGVGHTRRRGLEPGAKSEAPAEPIDVAVATLSDKEWRILEALKREFTAEELTQDLWVARARESGVALDEFLAIARDLNQRRVIGRFSTFLEHIKPQSDGQRVTRFNALFHWAVPAGREIEAGCEVGRHHILTHAYWREGGQEFGDVNIMAVAHGTDKKRVLDHKTAIDEHLNKMGIPVNYTNVFWGGRSEIKPSEISPIAYREWCRKMDLEPEQMRE